MWLLLIKGNGNYIVHSAHENEADARAWQACKEFDGEDTALAILNMDALDEVSRILETKHSQKAA